MQKPDPATQKRIANLSKVGKAIVKRSDDKTFETDYYLAIEALNEFQKGIEDLELDTESIDGMKALIEYLRVKINKRIDAQVHGKALE